MGLVSNVANLDEGQQPLIDDDAHQLGKDEQSTNGRKFQGASRNIRVDQGFSRSTLTQGPLRYTLALSVTM